MPPPGGRVPPLYDDHYIDLLCFAKHLCKNTGADLRDKADALMIVALKLGKGRTILCQGKIGREVRSAGGLSIYSPGDQIIPPTVPSTSAPIAGGSRSWNGFCRNDAPENEDYVMKKEFAEEQRAFALKQSEHGTSVAEATRKLGIAEQIYYH